MAVTESMVHKVINAAITVTVYALLAYRLHNLCGLALLCPAISGTTLRLWERHLHPLATQHAVEGILKHPLLALDQ